MIRQVERGVTEKGYSHLLATTLSLCAAGPATVLSHKCDIPSLWKDDQIPCDNRLSVHCRRSRSLRALWAKNHKKSQKESVWGSAKKYPKVPKKSNNTPQKSNFNFWVFLIFSGIFRDLWKTPKKTLFEIFFATWGPEGPETPVNGRSGRKHE